MESTFHSDLYRQTFLQLLNAYTIYMEQSSNSHCGDLIASSEEEAKVNQMVPELARFGILALEYVKWILTSNNENIGALDYQVILYSTYIIVFG